MTHVTDCLMGRGRAGARVARLAGGRLDAGGAVGHTFFMSWRRRSARVVPDGDCVRLSSGWLPSPSSSALQADCVAGVTVGLMTVPQVLAYAKSIAGLPVQVGSFPSRPSSRAAVGFEALPAVPRSVGLPTSAFYIGLWGLRTMESGF